MNTEQHNAPALASSPAAPSPNATALAPSGLFLAPEFCWSTDQETYRDRCNTVAEAVAEAISYNDGLDGCQVGTTVYIGEVISVGVAQLFSAGDLIDTLRNRAYDLVGESSDGYLDAVTEAQRQQLEDIVEAWANSVQEPDFWQIGKVLEYKLTARDLNETCESGQPECGPVEHYDSEGVPLCAVCWEGLLAESAAADAGEVKS